MSLSPNLRGALFMSLAMAGFTANDALTKGLLDQMNIGQVMLVRGIFATAMITLLAMHQGALARPAAVRNPKIVIRIFGDVGGTVAFLAALAYMPLGNITAVLQALPLAVTMGAALFLGERVGWRRWLAIAVGFVGVMVIVRPGLEGFNAYSLLVLLAVGVFAVRDLATRLAPGNIPSLLITTTTSAAVTTLGALLIVPLGGWKPMSLADIGQLAAAAVLVLVGYQFVIMSVRSGDLSSVAPFRYISLLWALLLGALLFGEVPDTAMLAGAALVVGSGIYMIYRERRIRAPEPAAESMPVKPSQGA